MDCLGVCVVAEVEGREIEEVDDQDDLRPDEVATDEEHDPGELKEVVEDEVTTDTSSGLDVITILGEEVPHVTDLGEEESEPGRSQWWDVREEYIRTAEIGWEY